MIGERERGAERGRDRHKMRGEHKRDRGRGERNSFSQKNIFVL